MLEILAGCMHTRWQDSIRDIRSYLLILLAVTDRPPAAAALSECLFRSEEPWRLRLNSTAYD